MYARVFSARVKPGQLQEVRRIYEEVIIPPVREQKGFREAFFLVDPDTEEGISVSIWETETDMKSSASGGFLDEQVKQVAPVLASEPKLHHYRVGVHATVRSEAQTSGTAAH